MPMWSVVNFLGLLIVVSYSYFALEIKFRNASDIRDLRIQVDHLHEEYEALSHTVEARIQALESTTYVDLLHEVQKNNHVPSVLETWQKNRDAAIIKRLDALERWRLSAEPTK
jgi:uncharacterized membrane protein